MTKAAQRMKEWRLKNPEKAKAISHRAYKKHREVRLANAKQYQIDNKDRIKAKGIKLKLEVMQVYGNQECACCGETDFEFLTIDHIDGGGTKHRQEIKRSGTSFYRWLKQNNYPEGYRVLCFNCNCALGMWGYCPHRIWDDSFESGGFCEATI